VAVPQRVMTRTLPLKAAVPVYIAAIAGAEASIAFASVSLGVVLDALVVLVALNHYLFIERGVSETDRLRSHEVLLAAENMERSLRRLRGEMEGTEGADALQRLVDDLKDAIGSRSANRLLVLPLVPLLRISDLTMTVKGVPPLGEYALVGLPVLGAAAWVSTLVGPRRLLRRLRAWSWQQLGIGICGVPLGLVAFLVFRPHPLGTHPSTARIVWGSLIVVVFVGFLEEVIFRGLLQDALTDLYGRSGIAWSSLLFAVASLGVHPPAYVPFAAAVGLAFGWVVERTASLVGVILAHSFLAVGLILVWPRVLG
jgi:membrane protease YdiL (CAAX protease family)